MVCLCDEITKLAKEARNERSEKLVSEFASSHSTCAATPRWGSVR
jgi:hypothetical protein